MLKNVVQLVFIYLVIIALRCENVPEIDSLLMVHALFRHGERTTEAFYPTDPYINYTFHPYGIGDLTNRGRWQAYKLGQFLRKRYDSFLGDIYTDSSTVVRATGFDRTRKTALLALAGLWPAKGDQIWNDKLLWQPIPVDYKRYEDDDLLNPGMCARRTQILRNQDGIEEVMRMYIKPYGDFMKYAQEKSKFPLKNPNDIVNLYLILKTEEGTNLTLPEWTKEIYPEPFYSAAALVYNYVNHHLETSRINSGYLLSKIIKDFKSRTYGEDKTQMFLYSGHESTVGQFLSVLGMEPHIPNYTSIVMIELHQIKNQYFVKMVYRREEDGDSIENIVLKNCDVHCPLDKFELILKRFLPLVPYEKACRLK